MELNHKNCSCSTCIEDRRAKTKGWLKAIPEYPEQEKEEHEEDNLREVQGYKPLRGRVADVKTYCAGIIKNSWHMNERQIAERVIKIIDKGE